MKLKAIFALSLVGIAIPTTSAQAHVSIHPNEVPTGSFATLDIRVPNETDNANTNKVAVQFPPGFLDASTEFLPGWQAKVLTRKLASPVKTADGTVTEEVSEIVWTGDGKLGKVPPGNFLNFPISVEMPGKAGQTLTFKTLQYYDNGQVVRWIGPPSSEQPAPTLAVTAAGGVLQDVAGTETGPPAGRTSSTSGGSAPAESSDSGDSASKGLGIAALIVGALGLLAGGVALIRSRRPEGGANPS